MYQPSVPDGAIRCDDSQRCPRGLVCSAFRDGATVLLVCCRNPGCPGVAPSPQATGASSRAPGGSADPPPNASGNPGAGTIVGPIPTGLADAAPADAGPADSGSADTVNRDGAAPDGGSRPDAADAGGPL